MMTPSDASGSGYLLDRGPRALAVVSGKGGSGKTIIATSIGRILDRMRQDYILIDADTGTAGMTLYLTLTMVEKISAGLVDVAQRLAGEQDARTSQQIDKVIDDALQPIKGSEHGRFFGIGNPNMLAGVVSDELFQRAIVRTVESLRSQHQNAWLIIDCRGGIDQESLEACRVVDDILLVVESDITSLRAGARVADVLRSRELQTKLRGFFINKTLTDPMLIVNSSRGYFNTQYLAAIPVDIRAMHRFVVGLAPTSDSLLATHVRYGLGRLYPTISQAGARVWDPDEYAEATTVDGNSVRGGIVLASLLLLALIVITFSASTAWSAGWAIRIGSLGTLGLIAAIGTTRRFAGRLVRVVSRRGRRLRQFFE